MRQRKLEEHQILLDRLSPKTRQRVVGVAIGAALALLIAPLVIWISVR